MRLSGRAGGFFVAPRGTRLMAGLSGHTVAGARFAGSPIVVVDRKSSFGWLIERAGSVIEKGASLRGEALTK